MSNDLESAASNFSEQSKKLQIAMYYTYDDQDKSKKMLAGSYLDLYVIKGRFSSSSVYGAFLLFINYEYLKIMHTYTIVSRSYETSEIKTSKDWRNFEREMISIANTGDFDEAFTGQLKEFLNKGLNVKELTTMVRLLEQDDAIALNHDFQRFLIDVSGYQNIEVSIDYEKISSLTMEMHSVTSTKVTPEELAKGHVKAKPPEVKIEKIDDPLAGKDVKLILNGTLILSPIKGKDIGSLVEGDRIKLSLVDNNPKAVEVAKAFNAYDAENSRFKPITGRIISRKHEGVYTFFAIVAKGIFVKIVEEEDSIKVAMDPAFYDNAKADDDTAGSKNNMGLIVAALIFLILTGVVIYYLLKS
jgi:hypothetical protein